MEEAIEFSEFRDEINERYRQYNEGADVRLEVPSDQDKLHMLIAVDSYLNVIEQKMLEMEMEDNEQDDAETDIDWDEFFRK